MYAQRHASMKSAHQLKAEPARVGAIVDANAAAVWEMPFTVPITLGGAGVLRVCAGIARVCVCVRARARVRWVFGLVFRA